jgi:Apea-like HEPN
LAADSFELREILAVDGFDVDGNVELGAYELMAWSQVPMTDSKWRVLVSAHFTGSTPRAALVRRHKIEPVHLRPSDGETDYVARAPIEPALDVLRCVTASSGAGIRRLHYWFEPEEWAPWVVNRSGFGIDSTSMAWPVALDESQVLQLCSCVKHFMAFEERDRSRLRVPMDRLNGSYLARMRSVDVAIEVGIALESLHAPSKLNEGIGYAVRTRAARFLGGSLDERKGGVKLLKDVYDLRSRAVHAGRFDAGEKSKRWSDEANVRKALEEGQSLVGKSLVEIIQEGEPNWEDFDIGPEVGHS